MAYHEISIANALEKLNTNEKIGLKSMEVKNRLFKNGKNEITDHKKQGLVGMFFSQFKDLMIIILLISALISFLISYFSGTGEYYDFIIILSIVLANGIIGTVQEYKAEKAIEALKEITAPTVRVIRDGKNKTIDSKDLVVGDIVLLKTGDVCAADMRLLSSIELTCGESSLTGESMNVNKNANVVLNHDTPISEMKNMVFAAADITTGYGKAVVTAVGMNTEIGKIARLLQNENSPETPLQKKLNATGKLLGIGVMIICVIIFALGVFKNISPLDMLIISISLAVAAIPEGLTAVVTIVLSMGVKRMANKKAIVRKLPAVETLGGVTVICSDKTGTLTENKMKVVELANVQGYVSENSNNSEQILGLAGLCCNYEKNQKGKITGNPTELAIIKSSENYLQKIKDKFPKIAEIPFSSSRKIMTTVHKNNSGYLLVTKGAPDYVIKRCSHVLYNGNSVEINNIYQSKILAINKEMAEKAFRVIAVAKKECNFYSNNNDENENNLTFCGLIAIEDPPRKEAKQAVENCKKAGIIPVMITGDQVATAIAIATKIGIYTNDYKYMTGQTLASLSEGELAKIINEYRVFARVTPEDKVKIVKAFRATGELVAMTGDGVNDAPALKTADIGCAMGKNGTEVAKSSADMILTDDNFATIVEAVKEGRGIFLNIRKTIHFLLSCNMGEILLIFLAFLMGLPVPLLATQILWVNLVTDSFPALALGASKADSKVMQGEFKESKTAILNTSMIFSMLLEGAFIGVMSLIAFIIGRNFFDTNIANPVIGRTMCFCVLCLSQIVHSFNVSSESSIFSKKANKNKWLLLSCVFCTLLLIVVVVIPNLNVAFKTINLNSLQWGLVLALSIIPLFVAEIEKFTYYLFLKRVK